MRQPTIRAIELVESLLAAGCDMWAAGNGYYIGEPTEEESARTVQNILRDFGSRRHLMGEISRYLRSIGRDIQQAEDL